MPVPVRDTPLGRELYDEGHDDGRHEGRLETLRGIADTLLRQDFGDDPRIDAIAERLAALPAGEFLSQIRAAASLDDLARL